MIFVSSSCVEARCIGEAVEVLAREGYRDIELSGGTDRYENLIADLLALKDVYGLRYRCHNYFPPPERHFALNLASADPATRERSIAFCLEAVETAARLGSDAYSFHAGFFMDPGESELGRRMEKRNLVDRAEAERRFFAAHALVAGAARERGIEVFVENNVLSASNWSVYGEIPFMLCSPADFDRLEAEQDFGLLLDLAHLKVSCRTLGLPFAQAASSLLASSRYVHVSDNDGTEDTNDRVSPGTDIAEALRAGARPGTVATVEVYGSLDSIRSSYETLQSILAG